MIFKKKNLIVALVSGVVISLVLIMTLVGYLVYIEIRESNARSVYNSILGSLYPNRGSSR